MTRLSISEAQVEDALVGNLDLLARQLKVDRSLKLVARQLPLKGGEQRLDMLLACGKRLALVELKATKFAENHLQQTVQYREILQEMQEMGDLTAGEIDAYLLVTEVKNSQIALAWKEKNVRVLTYNPLDVMNEYFRRMSALSPFLKIKPKDWGAYSIARISGVARVLVRGLTRTAKIAAVMNLNAISVSHLLSAAIDFNLVRKKGDHWFLTDFGDAFVSAGDMNALSPKQAEMIRGFVSKNPFYSPTVFGIYAIVECAFLLARNSYPVEISHLENNFRMVSGKGFDWRPGGSVDRQTSSFLRFAVELELLGRIGKRVVITPAGFRFILMMQLHKGIEMIEGLSFQDDG